MNAHARRPLVPLSFAALAAMGSLAWSGPSLAGSACLKGASINKLCLSIDSVPGTSVQPSNMPGGTTTYIKYTVSLKNLVSSTSRNVQVDFSINPAPSSALNISADPGLSCSVASATMTCYADKIDGVDPVNVTVTAEAPTYPTTASQVVATSVFGWNGNTATATQSIGVSNTSGTSFVPAGHTVTLATNDSNAVTPASPRYASVELPAQPYDYEAQLAVINNAPTNTNCVAGVYLSTTYGGPFLCRDLANPMREVQLYTRNLESLMPVQGAALTPAVPGRLRMRFDTSIVQAAQLPPNPPVAPTGLPPFAIFQTSANSTLDQPLPATAAYAAISKTCDSIAAPCLLSVSQDPATSDWTTDSLVVNTQEPATLIGANATAPLRALYLVLNLLVPPAEAQVIPRTRLIS